MINVNVFDINDPRRAKAIVEMEKQAYRYESLQGGVHAMMGNAWDPWNVLGISWQMYNDYKSQNFTDEEIIEEIKKNKDDPEFKNVKTRIERYKAMM